MFGQNIKDSSSVIEQNIIKSNKRISLFRKFRRPDHRGMFNNSLTPISFEHIFDSKAV